MAGAAGVALGVAVMAGGALLLYADQGLLPSAGFLVGLTLLSIAAGVWVGAPEGPPPRHRRMIGRWTLAVVAMVAASFMASAWMRLPALQTSGLGPAVAVVLLVAEPAYAIGAVLSALHARGSPADGRSRGGVVLVAALTGTAAGAVLAGGWLIPSLPPGPVYLGAALVLAAAGTFEMRRRDGTEAWMRERVVIVSGASDAGQLGYAVARAFHRSGARLVLAARSEAVAERARELGNDALGVTADLTTEDGAERVVEAARSRWGRIDALVNVAGGLRVMKSLMETSPGEWREEVERNAATPFLMARAALPLLRESRGVIINFASPAGERAVAGLGAYSAAKAAVVALTRALALEERPHGVRVNAIAPGLIDTEQNRAVAEDPERVKWVTREQVAEVALFLASPASSGVNGQVIQVPGEGLR